MSPFQEAWPLFSFYRKHLEFCLCKGILTEPKTQSSRTVSKQGIIVLIWEKGWGKGKHVFRQPVKQLYWITFVYLIVCIKYYYSPQIWIYVWICSHIVSVFGFWNLVFRSNWKKKIIRIQQKIPVIQCYPAEAVLKFTRV